MSARVFRLLRALYPRAWRDRYANELRDLCDEFVDAGEIPRWRLALDIIVAATVERLRSRRHSARHVVIGGGATAVLMLGIIAAATDGFGSFNAALSSKGPVPMRAYVNGHLDVSRVPDFVSVMSRGHVVGYTPKADLFPSPTTGVHLGPVGAPAIKPVYGPDLKTLVGDVYPSAGFVALGSVLSNATCNAQYTITNGHQQAIPCPSTSVGIPNVVGMDAPTGVAKLSSLGLDIQIVNVESKLVPVGHIVSTAPVAGETVAARSVITVDISVRT